MKKLFAVLCAMVVVASLAILPAAADAYCAKCDATVEVQVKDANAATCTDAGYTGDVYCTTCGELVSSGSVIPAPGHDTADVDNDHICDRTGCTAVISTCADGDNDHYCDVCNKELTTCADSDNDHNCDVCGKGLTTCADKLSTVTGQAATCTADGWKDHYSCSICGKLYSDSAAASEITDLAAWKTGDGKIAAAHSDEVKKEYKPIYDEVNKTYDMKKHTTISNCKECGETVDSEEQPHVWVNGKCAYCNLNCSHASEHKEYAIAVDASTGKSNVSTHIIYTICDTCGEITNQTTAAHKWNSDGKCTDCLLICDHSQNDNHATCGKAADCSVCGKKNVEAALSHWFSEWKPCSDGYHAAYCIRKGCDGTAGMPCEWFDLTFTTGDDEEMTVSICPVCGAVRHEDTVFKAIKSATVKMGSAGLPRGELIVRGMSNPYGDCQYAFTVGYEFSGWLEKFLGDVTITIPVKLEGDFRLVYVTENLEGQVMTDVEYTYANGKLSFETSDQGIFLILPVEQAAEETVG